MEERRSEKDERRYAQTHALLLIHNVYQTKCLSPHTTSPLCTCPLHRRSSQPTITHTSLQVSSTQATVQSALSSPLRLSFPHPEWRRHTQFTVLPWCPSRVKWAKWALSLLSCILVFCCPVMSSGIIHLPRPPDLFPPSLCDVGIERWKIFSAHQVATECIRRPCPLRLERGGVSILILAGSNMY